MLANSAPAKIPLPFANAGSKRTIPAASQQGVGDGSAASLTDGFPPLTMIPKAAGGIPPSGLDFNGILNEITAIQQWQCAGGLFVYDASFSTSVGGYPKGALLLKADASGMWRNTVDGNTSNPDTGGAGWATVSAAYQGNLLVTASQSFTVPAGVFRLKYTATGAGGGGMGCIASNNTQTFSGSGGGAGATAIGYLSVTPGQAIPIVIGAAGAAATASTASNGGDTTISGATAGGGRGASFGTAVNTAGGAGGTASGGDINIPGGDGSDGQSGTFLLTGNGGGSYWGGGGRAGSVTGIAGRAFGAGGGGAYDSTLNGVVHAGGAGAPGCVFLEW